MQEEIAEACAISQPQLVEIIKNIGTVLENQTDKAAASHAIDFGSRKRREMVEFVSQAAFARAICVSRMAICKALQAGRLQPYDEAGRPVSPDVRGPKFLKLDEARQSFDESRVRLDDSFLAKESDKSGPPRRDLLSARTRTSSLQAELLQMRLAREQGEVIPRAAAMAAVEALGRAVKRAHKAIPGWAEEITGAAQIGGVAAVSGLLRAKSAELGNSVADLITAVKDCAG